MIILHHDSVLMSVLVLYMKFGVVSVTHIVRTHLPISCRFGGAKFPLFSYFLLPNLAIQKSISIFTMNIVEITLVSVKFKKEKKDPTTNFSNCSENKKS